MPIARVQMPDGRIGRFEVPEGTTPEEVEAFIATQEAQTPSAPVDVPQLEETPSVPFSVSGEAPPIPEPGTAEELGFAEEPGFAERVTTDLQDRARLGEIIDEATAGGEQTFAEGLLQTAGQVGAGGILDLLGETMVAGVKGLSAITPDEIEDPLVQGATKAAMLFLNTDIGKAGLEAAQQGLESWNQFKSENPRAARNIESVVDIGLLIAPVRIRPRVKAQPTAVGRASEGVAARAEVQTARQKADFIDDLVLPKQTPSVRTEQVARTTEEGAFRTKQIGLSQAERSMADEVSKVPEVGTNKSLQGNYIAIADEVSKESNALIKTLKKNDVIFSRSEVKGMLNQAIERVQDAPLLTGDALKQATNLSEEVLKIAERHPSSASGLLEVRKEFDRFVKSQRPQVLDPKTENALTKSVKEVRTSINNFIDEKAVNVEVTESLLKQSNLLSSMDNISPKAGVEARNSILRAWQNANQVLGIKGAFNQTLATAFGIGGLGAAAEFAPLFTSLVLSGGLTYIAGKAIMSPQAKIGVSKLLGAVDKSIRTTKDADLIAELKLDRVAIVELLKQAEER